MSFRRFLAVLRARNLEFLRDRAALGWNFAFPMIVVFGFAFAFSGSSQNLFKVAVHRSARSQPLGAGFLKTQYIQFIDADELEAPLQKLRHHQLDMVVSLEESGKYWINSSAPKGYLLEKILQGTDAGAFQKQIVDGKEIRYVDWLISGLLGMNVMFSALFGVGYVIVRYRKNGVLKRLKATPLHAFEFLTAQVISRLLLILLVSIIVYEGCNLFLRFQMLGSYVDLLVVLVLGSICMISLGLLIASRIASEELAGGILNLISWPMMFLSGVWFSLEGLHPFLKKLALLLPLTHVIDASRAIMTEGAHLSGIMPNLLALIGMSMVFLAVGSLGFKWE